MRALKIKRLTWIVAGILMLAWCSGVYGAQKTAQDYIAQGKELLKARKVDQAIATFTKAIKADAKSAQAFNNRGVAYCEKGELKKAVADFGRAIKMDPKFGKAYNNRGVTLWYLGKKGQAEKDLKKAESLGIKVNRKALKSLGTPP